MTSASTSPTPGTPGASDISASAIPVPDGPDAGAAWHYGDPLGEQRTLARAAGVVARDNRDVLAVTGPDRLEWLHSITSQHLSTLADGDSTQALVLSPHGHVEQHWQLTDLGGVAWIDTEPGAGREVLSYLQKMIFMKRVEPLDVSADWAALTVAGPASGEVLTAAGLPVPSVGRAVALPDAGFVRGRTDDDVDLLVPRGDSAAYIRRLVAAGVAPVGLWAYEARRVERRLPRLGLETDHRTIPHEVGWIGSAVHLNKGCYRGQETVARVHNLGKPPRRLVLLHLSGESDELPTPGTDVILDGRTVGFIGTTVQHHELGPIGLAVIKRSLSDDAALAVDGSPASIA